MLAVVAFGVFVAADDLLVVSTMLRPMIDDLGLVLPADLTEATWIVNAYLIAHVAVMPVAGYLSDLLGRRAVFIGGLTAFLLGSLLVPATDSFAVLLAGRVLTAVGGGALVPLALAVAGDLYVGRRRTRAFGVLSAVETLGWVWGPLYGALLVRFVSWRWQFHLNVPLAVVGIVLGGRYLDPRRRTAGPGIDWAGVALLTVGLVSLSIGLLSGAELPAMADVAGGADGGGASIDARWWYAVAVLAFAGFALVEQRVPRPLLDRALVGRRRPVAALVVNSIVGVAIVVTLVNVPLFVNAVEGGVQRSALLAGWLLTALTATMAVASYLGGAASGWIGWRPPTVLGLVMAALGLFAMGTWWTASTSHAAMALQLAVVGAGIGLVLAPSAAVVVDASADERHGAGAGLVIVFRLLGFTVGLAALTAWGLRRYGELRADLELPALGEPGYQEALAEAAATVTTTALSETFLGAALALAVAVPVAVVAGGRSTP